MARYDHNMAGLENGEIAVDQHWRNNLCKWSIRRLD